MSALETLQGLLGALSPDEIDVTLFGDDINLENIDADSIEVKSGGDNSKVTIRDDRVILYPDQLQGEEYAKYTQLVAQVKKEEDSIKRIGENEKTRALWGANKANIDETLSFFEGIISYRNVSLLRSALYLRQLSGGGEPFSKFDVDQQKAELKDRYGYEAYYVSHLASSGYFDEGRYFRNLYRKLEKAEGSTSRQYQEAFEQMIGEKLIAVFVNSADSTYDLKHDIRAGVTKHFRYHPRADFFDVCGVGTQCTRTIDRAIDDLSDEYPSMQYDERDRGNERVVRIYPGSFQEFGI